MLQRIVLSGVFSFISLLAFAQTGSIKGNIKDAASGENIVGATVVLAGTAQGTVADIDGNFSFPKVKTGTYSMIVSFISYKTDTLQNITVYPDQVTVVNTALREQSQQLAEVVITGGKLINTDVSVITEMKKADLVAVGISAQQISMSQDRDASQILKRIPGVSITNNRFVNVRGLSERYSVVLLNGVIAPSTEVDTRAFAFDLIPSNMIDRMMVYKSGSSELPGEFAGAVIDINTKSIVDENAVSINITGGFRAGTTFRDFSSYKGSSTDFLGFDNGKRDLPSDFPTENLRASSDINLIKSAGASLPNQYTPALGSAAPDFRTTINFSRSFYIGEMKFSNVTSLNYSNSYQRYDQQNFYYDQGTLDQRYAYQDKRYSHVNRTGLISNFILELNPSNKIEFSNLINQQGNSQVTLRSGQELNLNEVRNTALNYWERGFYSGQLQGKHSLTNALNVKWVLGYSAISSDQPDYRRYRTQKPIDSDNQFELVVPPGASAFDGRFYSSLDEKVYTHAVNIDLKLNPKQEDEDKQAKLLAGYYLAQTERDFSARWFSFKQVNYSVEPGFLSQPLEKIFAAENVNSESPTWLLEEGTNFSDKYHGKNSLIAGYTGITIPFAGKFRVAAGTRVENNRQQLNSFKTNGEALEVNNPVTSILPFANIAYNFTEKALFRLAFSQTVNRPVFREIAPFNYYDFDRNANFFGNPNLKVAEVSNIDFRWEYYPDKNESISIGAFYKDFTNPIEVLNVGGSNLLYTFGNAKSAQNYGVEIELRKSLRNLTTVNAIDNISINMNAAIIDSKVSFDTADPMYANQESGRYMQGQSPYLVNFGLNYNDLETGWQVNAAYNVFGPRIFSAGDNDENPTQYEMPRHQIDLTISKEINAKWNIKLGVQDIFNQKYRILQDQNRDQKIAGDDKTIFSFSPGQYLSVGVTYQLRRE
jgi:TonB-dependent receptor